MGNLQACRPSSGAAVAAVALHELSNPSSIIREVKAAQREDAPWDEKKSLDAGDPAGSYKFRPLGMDERDSCAGSGSTVAPGATRWPSNGDAKGDAKDTDRVGSGTYACIISVVLLFCVVVTWNLASPLHKGIASTSRAKQQTLVHPVTTTRVPGELGAERGEGNERSAPRGASSTTASAARAVKTSASVAAAAGAGLDAGAGAGSAAPAAAAAAPVAAPLAVGMPLVLSGTLPPGPTTWIPIPIIVPSAIPAEVCVGNISSFPVSKRLWCCDNLGIDCTWFQKPPANQTAAPARTTTMDEADWAKRYACGDGISWPQPEMQDFMRHKRAWCCKHKGLDCATSTAAPAAAASPPRPPRRPPPPLRGALVAQQPASVAALRGATTLRTSQEADGRRLAR